jgi:hypothetical protein
MQAYEGPPRGIQLAAGGGPGRLCAPVLRDRRGPPGPVYPSLQEAMSAA